MQASKTANSLSPKDSMNRKDTEKLWWDEVLRDNLLSFATTPKGVLLLQQSGALTPCVTYMLDRHKRRLQVGFPVHGLGQHS